MPWQLLSCTLFTFMDSFRFAFLFQLSSCRRRSLTNQTCFSYRWPALPFQFNALFGLNTCFLLLQKISQLYLRGAAWVCTIDFVSDGGLSLCADCDCLVPSICCQYLKHDGCTYFLEWEANGSLLVYSARTSM